MKREEISKKVCEIISDKFNYKKVDESDNMETLGADSLDYVEIVMDIEEYFAIDIADDEFENIKTVKEFVDLVEKKLNGK